ELGGWRGRGAGRTLTLLAPALAAAAVVAIWLGTRGPATSAAGSGAARPSSPIDLSLAIERRSAGMRGGAGSAGAGDSAAQVGDVLRPKVRGEDERRIVG